MADEVTLLGFWPSLFAMRVKIALAEKGVEYESTDEDLSNKSPLLLMMNPVNKQIPVLIHNGKPVCESRIIVEYIDQVWAHNPLLPSDPYHVAQAKFWAEFVDKKMYPLARQVWLSTGEAQEAPKSHELIECFKLLEGELGDKPYFGGETFGFVDVALIPFNCWFYMLEKLGNFSMVEECPKLVDWAHRCIERESVSKAVPDQLKAYDFFIELKKKLTSK